MQNKIYAYHYNFNAEPNSQNIYDEVSSKLKFNIKRLFKEDLDVQQNEDQMKLIQGEVVDFSSIPNRYNIEEVYERFKNLMQFESDIEN